MSRQKITCVQPTLASPIFSGEGRGEGCRTQATAEASQKTASHLFKYKNMKIQSAWPLRNFVIIIYYIKNKKDFLKSILNLYISLSS